MAGSKSNPVQQANADNSRQITTGQMEMIIQSNIDEADNTDLISQGEVIDRSGPPLSENQIEAVLKILREPPNFPLEVKCWEVDGKIVESHRRSDS